MLVYWLQVKLDTGAKNLGLRNQNLQHLLLAQDL